MKNAISAASLGLVSSKVGELSLANSLYERSQAEALRNERIIEAQQLTGENENENAEEPEETIRG